MSTTPKNSKKRRKSSTPQHGQLTGIARKISDGVVDIHSSIQKWEALKNKGFNIATEIANLKIDKRNHEERSCYPDGLQALCHDFLLVGEAMERLCEKIEEISAQFEKIRNMSTVSPSDIFFFSWPPGKFADSCGRIAKMYREELKAKAAIVEDIAHVDFVYGYFSGMRTPDATRDVLMSYVACWLHEPCIDEDERTIILEELLLETGHRS